MEKKRILIVDDELGLARLLQANLNSCGRYETLVEHRAESAVTAARAFRPHVVLLDAVMPCLSGPEVADQIRADPGCAGAVVIFLTAAEQGTVAAGHDGGPAGAGASGARADADAGGRDVLTSSRATATRSATTVSVTVRGRSISVIPGWSPNVTQSASLPVERLTAP